MSDENNIVILQKGADLGVTLHYISLHFCRAMLCIARLLPACGVCLLENVH